MKKTILIFCALLFALPVLAIELPNSNDIVYFVNEERRSRGLTTLSVDFRLTESAKAKAKSLSAIGDLRHTKSGDGIVWWPLKDAGYDYRLAGENLALNIPSAEEIVSSWMSSSSHRENIVDRSFEHIGVAVVEGYFQNSPASYVVMYTADPKEKVVLGAVSGSREKTEKEKIEELMEIIIDLMRQIMLIQRNINA